MKSKSLILLIIFLIQNILGTNVLNSVNPVNSTNITIAYEAYARAAQWEPYIRYGTTGAALTAAAISAYCLYTYKEKIGTFLQANYILATMQDAPFAQAITSLDNEKGPTLVEQVFNWTKNNVWWIGATMATQAAYKITTDITYYELDLLKIKMQENLKKIPATGSLGWYIAHRTEFHRVENVFTHALLHYELYEEDISSITQELIYEVEKILGYLYYFIGIHPSSTHDSLATKPGERYIKNIERFTNDLVTHVNHGATAKTLLEKLQLIKTEIMHAIQFVEPRN